MRIGHRAAMTLALSAALAVPGAVAAQGGPSDTRPGFGHQQEEEPELGWRGSADLGFTLTEGNSETTSLSASANVVRRADGSRWTLDGSLVRTTSDGEEVANRGDAAVQYDWFASERSYLFARGAAAYNEPAGIDLRLAPAAGAGWQALSRERLALSLEAGASWIRDEFSDGSSTEALFLVASESFHLQVAEDTDLDQAVTWRPSTEDFGDFLLDARVKLTTMITEAVGLQVSLRDQFDSEPFVDPDTGVEREKNDLTFVTGVTFRF